MIGDTENEKNPQTIRITKLVKQGYSMHGQYTKFNWILTYMYMPYCVRLFCIAIREYLRLSNLFKKRGLFGSCFCKLYKRGASICWGFWWGLRKLGIREEEQVCLMVREKMRERRRRQVFFNNQFSCELIEWEFTHYYGEGTKLFVRDPSLWPKHLPLGPASNIWDHIATCDLEGTNI